MIALRVSFPCFVFPPSATRCASRATGYNTRDPDADLLLHLQTKDLVMSATTAAPRLEATTATIALVAVPLRLVATGKINPAIACISQRLTPDCHIHSYPTHNL